MKIWIGADSFDSPLAGCTTHLTSLLVAKLEREGIPIIGHPYLIRFNPSIPWKTRGNGATAVKIETNNASKLTRILEEITRDYSNKKSAIIAVREEKIRENKCVKKLYKKMLTQLVLQEEAKKCLEEIPEKDIIFLQGEHNIGVKGALASIGASINRKEKTYELITYRHPTHWHDERLIDEKSVIEYDYTNKPYTFLNYDYINKRILIAPRGLDPVLYGVRAEKPDIAQSALKTIKTKEKPLHYTIFATNQATNEHIAYRRLETLKPYDTGMIEGEAESIEVIEKGHIIIELCNKEGCITTAIYKETGTLNRALQSLKIKNTTIRVGGSVKPHKNKPTLNAEFVDIPVKTIIESTNTMLLDALIVGDKYARILPDPKAFHHLMKPVERYILEEDNGLL